MALPTTLNTTTPATNDALDQGDDQIRALKLLLADYIGIPVDPTSLTGAIAACSAAGVATFLQNLETKAGTAFKGILTHANAADRTYTFPDYTSRILQAGFGSIGNTSKNNTSTPNTQFDLDADVVWARNSSNDVVVNFNPGAAVTNNISTAGPVINGRDQASAFTNSTFVHFYWIWNGTTWATLSSAAAPPTGPTLPTGYTHWSYAAAVFLDSGGALRRVRMQGRWAHNDAQTAVLTNGVATTETAIALTSTIPANATAMALNLTLSSSSISVNGFDELFIRMVSLSNFSQGPIIFANTTVAAGARTSLIVPNVGQSIIYLIVRTSTGGTVDADITCQGYELPNGG
jgi:hypothetical protein